MIIEDIEFIKCNCGRRRQRVGVFLCRRFLLLLVCVISLIHFVGHGTYCSQHSQAAEIGLHILLNVYLGLIVFTGGRFRRLGPKCQILIIYESWPFLYFNVLRCLMFALLSKIRGRDRWTLTSDRTHKVSIIPNTNIFIFGQPIIIGQFFVILLQYLFQCFDLRQFIIIEVKQACNILFWALTKSRSRTVYNNIFPNDFILRIFMTLFFLLNIELA